ncbi:MAG TPA: hypothetical protein VH352_02490 [Pseudonocardiaceae bacterium]|jgi:hypothetical protein|nr:hypothetical protein [Pseudonocardiaceae bacterium]
MRRIAGLTATVFLALAAVVAPYATANAVSIDTECLGNFSRTFDPAVTHPATRHRDRRK